MNLHKIKDNLYYIDGSVNIGVLTNSKNAVLIDAGIDENTARKIKRLLQEAALEIKAIIITHAHADHFGGARYLVKTTGAKIYAAEKEKCVLENPLLEPVYLFGGACPPSVLRHKFFYGPSIKVEEELQPGFVTIAGITFEVVDLKGHSQEQIGIAANGVLYCADACIAREVLEKHKIPLNYSIEETLTTYQCLFARDEELFLPSHGFLTEDSRALITVNQGCVEAVIDKVLMIAKTPGTSEQILSAVCDGFDITISNTGQYYLANLTVMAYIGYLLERGDIDVDYLANRQIFRRK